jgi:octaprenyl-diphosphate synthase
MRFDTNQPAGEATSNNHQCAQTDMSQPLPENRPSSIDLAYIQAMMSDDMRSVDGLIRSRLESHVALINRMSYHIISSGGKRLRPLLLLLTARTFNSQDPRRIDLAAIIEFIHTATLLHDDVVDDSMLRRGQETANAIWGNEASVLVGDFLYSRAFEMMVDVGSMRVMEILARATNAIAEGEVLQLLNCNDADTTEESYRKVIRCKTAKLFEAAAQLGGIISGCTDEQEQAMKAYGMHLGTAFQLIDDALDYSASPGEIGKNIGDDLAEGKPTLPLIHAIRHGSTEQTQVIRNAIENGGRENIAAVLEAIEATGAIAYTALAAQREADKAATALRIVPSSPYKDALLALTEFSVTRTY